MSKSSAWSSMLLAYRQKMRLNQDDLAKVLGVTQATVCNYESGSSLPPLQSLSDLCDLLEMRGEERRTFIEEGYLAHAPDRVRSLVADLRRRISRLEAMCTKHGLDVVGP
jgi:transcriptional regulator with XRE-family HTH domain